MKALLLAALFQATPVTPPAIEHQSVEVKLPIDISGYALSPDRKELFVSSAAQGKILRLKIDMPDDRKIASVPFAPGLLAVKGEYLVAGVAEKQELRILKLEDFSQVATCGRPSNIRLESLVASPDPGDPWVYVSNGQAARIEIPSGRYQALGRYGFVRQVTRSGRSAYVNGLVDLDSMLHLTSGVPTDYLGSSSTWSWISPDETFVVAEKEYRNRFGEPLGITHECKAALGEPDRAYYVTVEGWRPKNKSSARKIVRLVYRRRDTREPVGVIDLPKTEFSGAPAMRIAQGRILLFSRRPSLSFTMIVPKTEPEVPDSVVLRDAPPASVRPGQTFDYTVRPAVEGEPIKLVKCKGPPGTRWDAGTGRITWTPQGPEFLGTDTLRRFVIEVQGKQRRVTYEIPVALLPDALSLAPPALLEPGAMPQPSPIHAIDWTPDGSRLMVQLWNPGRLLFVDPATGDAVTMPLPDNPWTHEFYENRMYLALLDSPQLLQIDLRELKVLKEIQYKRGKAQIRTVTLASEKGRGYVVIQEGRNRAQVALFNPRLGTISSLVKTGKGRVWEPSGGRSEFHALSFRVSPDGRELRSSAGGYALSSDGRKLGRPMKAPWVGLRRPGFPSPLIRDLKRNRLILGRRVLAADLSKEINQLKEDLWPGPGGYDLATSMTRAFHEKDKRHFALMNLLALEDFTRVATVAVPSDRSDRSILGVFWTSSQLLVVRRDRILRYPVREILAHKLKEYRLKSPVVSASAKKSAGLAVTRGTNLLKRDDTAGARKEFEKARALDPTGPGQLGLARCAAAEKKTDEAIGSYRRAAEVARSREDAILASLERAELHRTAKDLDTASRVLLDLILRYPSDKRAYERRVRLAEESGSTEEAFRTLLLSRKLLGEPFALGVTRADLLKKLRASNVTICPDCLAARETCDFCGGSGEVVRIPCGDCAGLGSELKMSEDTLGELLVLVVARIRCGACDGRGVQFERKP